MDNTIKQISEHPASNAVTSPTDKDVKQKDIERKMGLYGVVEAFREGRYPSNRQIDETLDYTLKHSPVETAKLSKEGRMLVQDFRNIITTAKRIVKDKNSDELAQEFLYNTRNVDYQKGNLKNVDVNTESSELKDDGQQAAEHLRVLGKLIFTNSEARKLLKDIGLLGRDVLADAAVKVSEVARPDDRELARVDEPAPSNQWVGPDGETRGAQEPVPSTGLGELRDQAQSHASNLPESAQNEAQSTANRVSNAADQGQQSAGGVRADDGDRANAAANAGANQAEEEKDRLVNKLSNKIPQEHKDLAKEHYGKAKDYAKDKFPEERRQRFIYRLKKVIVECQRHADYKEAIEFFLERAENYTHVAKHASSQSADKGVAVRNDSNFQQAENQLRTLLERFANGAPMQPIFDAVNQLYTDASNDEQLKNYFRKLDHYVRQVLQEPGYIMKEASDKEGERLQQEGKQFFDAQNGKYAGHKDNLTDAIGSFFSSYADDPLNVQLGEDVKKLMKDLTMDAEGNLKYKPHLWNDIREVILPSLVNSIGYIPIPRIEYTDNSYDVVIENLTLEGANLLPNVIEIEARNYFKVSPYANIKDVSKHSFMVSFSQIQADLKDVAFYVKKKTGFPKLKDSGLADVTIAGSGISGKIILESTGRKDHAFKVQSVNVKIDKMKFKVRDAKFSFLINTVKPIILGAIKRGVAVAIQEAIRNGLVQIDAQLADISERIDRAKDDDNVSTLDAIKDSFIDKKEQAQQKKDELTPPGQFAVSATAPKRDSMLVDWTSKNSIAGKTADKQAEVHSANHNWKSDAFNIVGARSTIGELSKNRSDGPGLRADQGPSSTSSHPTGTTSSSTAGNSLGTSAPTGNQAAYAGSPSALASPVTRTAGVGEDHLGSTSGSVTGNGLGSHSQVDRAVLTSYGGESLGQNVEAGAGAGTLPGLGMGAGGVGAGGAGGRS